MDCGGVRGAEDLRLERVVAPTHRAGAELHAFSFRRSDAKPVDRNPAVESPT